MFGDVLVHSGCIQNCGFYCGTSYECIQVDSELILCQDPINGFPRTYFKRFSDQFLLPNESPP
jgi:hypothetical protein